MRALTLPVSVEILAQCFPPQAGRMPQGCNTRCCHGVSFSFPTLSFLALWKTMQPFKETHLIDGYFSVFEEMHVMLINLFPFHLMFVKSS